MGQSHSGKLGQGTVFPSGRDSMSKQWRKHFLPDTVSNSVLLGTQSPWAGLTVERLLGSGLAPLAFPFVFSPQATSAGSSSLWKVGCPKECQHSLYLTSVLKEKVIYGERSCLSFKKKEVKHGFPELSWPTVWPCTIIWPVRQIPSRIKLKIWIIIVYLPHLGYFGIKWYDTCKMFGTPSGTKKKPSKC